MIHKTIITYGKGESSVAEILEDWENLLPSHIKLAYLPEPGKLKLRLSGKGDDKQRLENEIEEEIKEIRKNYRKYNCWI